MSDYNATFVKEFKELPANLERFEFEIYHNNPKKAAAEVTNGQIKIQLLFTPQKYSAHEYFNDAYDKAYDLIIESLR